MGAETTVETDEGRPDEAPPSADASEHERLAGELAVLQAENDRLRNEYTRLQQTQYRHTALALVAIGALAAVGALLVPNARTVLFALAGTGLFLGILTYYLTPERFLPATVGRAIYETGAENERQVVDELGLSDTCLYVPVGERPDVRLYVPQSSARPLPEESALRETFVVSDGTRGVAFRPTGDALFEEFERAVTGEPATKPGEIVSQLRDSLVEQFELVQSTEHSLSPDSTRDSGEVTVGVTDSVYGSLEQFDHPVVSLLGVGFAHGLNTPVEVSVETTGNDRMDAVVICRWPYEPVEETV